jgi:hypothetical protein
MRPTTLSAAILLALASNPLLAGEDIDETRAMDADGLVRVELTNGHVTIRGWDRSEFHIAGELSDAAEGFELRDTDGNIRFEEDIDRNSRGFDCSFFGCRGDSRDRNSELEIQIPRNSVLRFEGVNIDVDVSELQGNTEIEVVNGEIIAENLSGTVQLKTVNGEIEAENLDGRLALETVNGRIRDRDSKGSRIEFSAVNGDIRSNTSAARVSAGNVNGEIELQLGAVDELDISTVGGRVETNASLLDGAHVDISSVNGRIELAVPAGSSARFTLSTAVNGHINNELTDDQPVKQNRFVSSEDLSFELGRGNADVEISTVSGTITVCALQEGALSLGC